MTRRYTRRQFLGATGSVGVAGVSGFTSPTDTKAFQGRANTRVDETAEESKARRTEARAAELDPVEIRGALYVPSRAWNTFQMWHDYDEEVIERDLGYATKVNINAIRTWVSFEQWQKDAESLGQALDHFLQTADQKGITVLFGLFESVGDEPTEENLHATDPLNAPPVQSPSSRIVQNKSLWDRPREYVRWFMDRYRDDDRLLAIESMNEPGWTENMKTFTGGMFETMAEERGSVPLTVGSTSLSNNADYVDWGSDIFQFHYNFPSNEEVYHDLLPEANQLSDNLDMPVYLSEWQRIANYGWGSRRTVEQWQPDYASLAPVIHEYGMGNFFWSLMVKPAYVRYMRKRGIINGLFHEDGAVWNLADAKAIKAMSGNPEVDLEQRREWPQWAEEVKEHAFGSN